MQAGSSGGRTGRDFEAWDDLARRLGTGDQAPKRGESGISARRAIAWNFDAPAVRLDEEWCGSSEIATISDQTRRWRLSRRNFDATLPIQSLDMTTFRDAARRRTHARVLAALVIFPGIEAAAFFEDPPSADRFVVRMPGSVPTPSAGDGELLLMFVPAARQESEVPARGPFWARPHPLGAMTIRPAAGESVELRSAAARTESPESAAVPSVVEIERSGEPPRAAAQARWYPSDPSTFEGAFRVQAVFRPRMADPNPEGDLEWRSEVATVALSPDRADEIELQLELPRPAPLPTSRLVGPGDPPGMVLVEERGEMLAAAGVEGPMHRAWIVFPRGYHDLGSSRRIWPAIYVIPHEGDGRREAESLREAIAIPETRTSMPQAVWIVLDPSSPWGHHGFADSPVHGPRATALVEEFIPTIERRVRIVADGKARLLSGHGAGGWSAIWLQQEFPRDFGGTFVTSPETIDLSRIGQVDAYANDAFLREDGDPRAAYREAVAGRGEAIRTFVSQEARLAETASPRGRSGNRWHRWAARMSPLDEQGRPRPLFDQDGSVDRGLAERWWLRYDLAAALAREPLRRVPMWDRLIQVRVGSLDEHFHDRTLLSLRSYLADLRRELGLPRPDGGLIELVPGATFETIVPKATPATYRAMIDRLREVGLQDD